MAEVLLVEDNAVLRAMLTDILTELGHQVRAVPDAESVTGELLQEMRPSMIIADMVLPGASGDRLCAMLHQAREELNMRVLLISESDEKELARKARSSGADGYATKQALLSNPEAALATLSGASVKVPTPKPSAEEVIKAALNKHLGGALTQTPFTGFGSGVRALSGVVQNLSTTGCTIRANQPLKMGQTFTISFSANGVLQVRVKVISAKAGAGTGPTVGIEFLELTDEQRQQIETFIQASKV